jgi:hypothetical protein
VLRSSSPDDTALEFHVGIVEYVLAEFRDPRGPAATLLSTSPQGT